MRKMLNEAVGAEMRRPDTKTVRAGSHRSMASLRFAGNG